ncbi:hypothetical protein BDZ89DRAFT_1155514 [Hymenopellis radicata]|nr:hypothetical protein BDZ89DRAFT_1155514 [Hymenopellis radicata]
MNSEGHTMHKNAFSSLSVVQLAAPSRLLPSACCPDKDLVVLVSRLGTQERLSLWKLSGTKSWEVDITSGNDDHVVDVAWSPDGRSIAVAQKQLRVTIHSIQDGHEERNIRVVLESSPKTYSAVWWFKQEKPVNTESGPDIFQRDNIITGSSRSVLQSLPFLDHLPEEAQRSSATDLFAFQGSQTRTAPKPTTPQVIHEWPALDPNLLAASIDIPGRSSDPQKIYDDTDDSNVNSVMILLTDMGHLVTYYEGVYSSGWVKTHFKLSPLSMYKHPHRPTFYAHSHAVSGDDVSTTIVPVLCDIPILTGRRVRDMASLSTICKDLAWHLLRVVKEMRTSWFGSDTTVAARELGPKWIRALDAKQKEHVGQKDNNPILDLTSLLLTGRSSPALADFMGSGEQMSERGLQKWETAMTEALIKLRDFSEKRIAPACQRIHLVLEEIQGWSHIPEYALFELQSQDIMRCLELANRTIILAAWLAAAARREYSRFKEFMTWIKFELETAAALNAGNDTSNIHIQHDILEVNKYFISGLVVSPIDKWFMGPVPQFQPSDLRGSGTDSLPEALKRAREVLDNPEQLAWEHHVNQKDLNHIDRNIDALVQELVQQCQRVFARASGATGRSAHIIVDHADSQVKTAIPNNVMTRERTIFDSKNGDGEIIQYLAIASLSLEDNILCLTRVKYNATPLSAVSIASCLLECSTSNEDGERQEFQLLEAEFFDDESVVIVYRQDEGAYIATVDYHDLGYQELDLDGDALLRGRENLIQEALLRRGTHDASLQPVQVPIKRCRQLVGCESGRVNLVVNGRAGRRVACVLDEKGTAMESLDLEGDDAEENGLDE